MGWATKCSRLCHNFTTHFRGRLGKPRAHCDLTQLLPTRAQKKGGLGGKARGRQGGGKPWPADPTRACARAALDWRGQVGPTLTLAAAYAASVSLRARCFSKPTSCLGLANDGRLEGRGIASTNIARATSACVVYHSRTQMGNWRGWGVKSEVAAKNKAWRVTNMSHKHGV